MKKIEIELSKVERKQAELRVLSLMLCYVDNQLSNSKDYVKQYSTEYEELPLDSSAYVKKDIQTNYLTEQCSYDYLLKIKDMLEKLI